MEWTEMTELTPMGEEWEESHSDLLVAQTDSTCVYAEVASDSDGNLLVAPLGTDAEEFIATGEYELVLNTYVQNVVLRRIG